MTDACSQFRAAIERAGLVPPDDIVADGELHRFSSTGRPNDKAGWYRLYGDSIPAGCFGDWRTGISGKWRMNIGRPLTRAEQSRCRKQVESSRREREAMEAKNQEKTRKLANNLWNAAKPCGKFPYLSHKHVQGHGIRRGSHGFSDQLLVPVWDGEELQSLQLINKEGRKQFLPNGRVAGCYFLIGKPDEATILCIAEGFATAASIHEASGHAVAVAFNAGNLPAVAKSMRRKFPKLTLLICADDDWKTEGNPGLTKATEAARLVSAKMAIPTFFDESRPEEATDFNDMARLCGKVAVRKTIAAAIAQVAGDSLENERSMDMDDATPYRQEGVGFSDQNGPATHEVAKVNALEQMPTNQENEERPSTDAAQQIEGVTGVAEVQASASAAPARIPVDLEGESQVTDHVPSLIPELDERPAFRVFDVTVEHDGTKLKAGVWLFHVDREGHPAQSWVCSPLHVDGVTFDGQGNNFGRLLRFRNTLGSWRSWAMPMDLLRAGGDELRGELLAMGVEIDPSQKARNALASYLQSDPPARRLHCALQVGWCGTSFVLPDTVIGPQASEVIFQSGERGHGEHTVGGTLAGWQGEIAARAVCNPLLMIAISASFAGPLMAKCNAEGGGLHFLGDSSTGKTTLLKAACSTWGGPNYRRSWRATANGMEGAAVLFNDCLLTLDEISECDPREIGAIVYSLGNGCGKQRAGRTGHARPVTRWRCFVLSSGERTIATAMEEGGRQAKAGQGVRLLDVPVARALGAWDDLHDMPSGAAFSDALMRAGASHYGHAGRAFLEKLTRDERDLCAFYESFKALQEFSVGDGEGQDKRAAARFALLAMAGELATEYGVTGWQEGEAIQAAAEGLRVWRRARGRGSDERRQILDKVCCFLERHGDSRFSDADGADQVTVHNRAGWWRDDAAGRTYLLNADGMREALKGFDFHRALDILVQAGALPSPGADGKRARTLRIGGRSMKLYLIDPAKLVDDHGA